MTKVEEQQTERCAYLREAGDEATKLALKKLGEAVIGKLYKKANVSACTTCTNPACEKRITVSLSGEPVTTLTSLSDNRMTLHDFQLPKKTVKLSGHSCVEGHTFGRKG